MARSSVTLMGFSELEALLKELPQKVAKRAAFAAMRRAGNVMADEQRIRIQNVGTGEFRDSIVVKARSKNTAGLFEYGEVMRGGGSFKDASAALRSARAGGASSASRIVLTVGSSSPLAHLVEFGTAERFQKSGKSTGIMPMNPFVRPAWDAGADRCLQVIKTELLVEIRKAEAKLGRG